MFLRPSSSPFPWGAVCGSSGMCLPPVACRHWAVIVAWWPWPSCLRPDPGLRPWLCLLPAGWPWAGHLASLCFGFFIHQWERMAEPHRVVLRIETAAAFSPRVRTPHPTLEYVGPVPGHSFLPVQTLGGSSNSLCNWIQTQAVAKCFPGWEIVWPFGPFDFLCLSFMKRGTVLVPAWSTVTNTWQEPDEYLQHGWIAWIIAWIPEEQHKTNLAKLIEN